MPSLHFIALHQNMSTAYSEEITLPEPFQREFNGVRVPLVLRCRQPDSSVQTCAAWIAENANMLMEKLAIHGGILFRDFPIATGIDFHEFVCAFPSLRNLSYEESLSFAVRVDITDRVCTTNEGKNGGLVFHHEQAQTPLFPSKLFFFCEIPAEVGGGTGICPSDVVLQRLEERYPDFVRKCEEVGVQYSATLQPEADLSKGVGRSWKSYFGRDTREGVEARMAELGYTWEWHEGDTLHVTTPSLKAVSVAPGSGRRVFFNQLIAQVANAKEFSQSETPNMDRFLKFSDGTSVAAEILSYGKELCEATAVELQWQPRDVALLDNFLVMHARRPFEGKRRILASLAKD